MMTVEGHPILNTEFINTYGLAGYYLRNLDINTSSRVAMFSSLIHLLEDQKKVSFDEIYETSKSLTGEKLEKSSFQSFISKLEEALEQEEVIVGDDSGYSCSKGLLKDLNQAKKQYNKMRKNIVG